MRSAMAVIVNGPARAGICTLPLHSAIRSMISARRARSSATNQRAMRSKRGHQKAHTPGRDRIGPKHSRPIASSSVLREQRQDARIALDEFAQRRVHRDAEIGASGVLVELVERFQAAGCGGHRSRRDRGSRSRSASPTAGAAGRPAAGAVPAAAPARRVSADRAEPRRRAISGSGPSAPSRPTARSTASSRSSQRDGTVGTPSRRAARVSATDARAEPLREIMRGDADRALGQRDAEFPAHLPRHPRVVGRRTGPGALVEAAEHQQVGLLQPRFHQGPRSPGADGGRRPGARPCRKRAPRTAPGSADPAAPENRRRRRSARDRTAPPPRRPRRATDRATPVSLSVAARRSAASTCAETSSASGAASASIKPGKTAEAGFEPIDKPPQAVRSLPASAALSPAKPGAGRGPRIAASRRRARSRNVSRRQPAGGERMLQRGQQRHRRQRARRQIEHQAQKHAGRGAAERHAGRIVDVDIPAAQFGGDAARQLAVRRDQRRRHARAFRAPAAAAARSSPPRPAGWRNRSATARRAPPRASAVQIAPGVGQGGRAQRLPRAQPRSPSAASALRRVPAAMRAG